MIIKIRNVFSLAQFIIVLLVFTSVQTARADFIGVYAGAGSWYHSASGEVNHLGTLTDLEQDLGFEDDWSGFFYIAVEHPVPLVPNIRLSQYNVGTESNKTVTTATEFTFNSTAYTSGQTITAELQWDETDALLYYEFLDNIVSLDLGLGAKKITGELSVSAAGVTNTLRIEETLPTAYAMVGVYLPGTGINLSVDTTQSFLGDAEVVQTNTRISYETEYMLGIEAGYRSSKVNLDDITNVTGEMTFSGPFVNLLFHF